MKNTLGVWKALDFQFDAISTGFIVSKEQTQMITDFCSENADKFKGYTFDYIISNPPFGIDWKREADDVEKEHKLGDAGRFGVGLPAGRDFLRRV